MVHCPWCKRKKGWLGRGGGGHRNQLIFTLQASGEETRFRGDANPGKGGNVSRTHSLLYTSKVHGGLTYELD